MPDGRSRRPHHPAARAALRTHRRAGQPVDVGPRRPAALTRSSSAPPPETAPKASFTESEVTRGQWAEWSCREGVARADAAGHQPDPVPGGWPCGNPVRARPVWPSSAPRATGLAPAPVAEGTVVIGSSRRRGTRLQAGSPATVGGTELTVSAVVPDQWYSHTGVVWTTLADWRKLARITGTDAAGDRHRGHLRRPSVARRRCRQHRGRNRQHHPEGVLPGAGVLQERKRFPAADAGVPVRDLSPGHRGVPDGVDRAAHPGRRRPQGPGGSSGYVLGTPWSRRRLCSSPGPRQGVPPAWPAASSPPGRPRSC